MNRKFLIVLLVLALGASAFFGCVPKIPTGVISDIVEDAVSQANEPDVQGGTPSGDASGGASSGDAAGAPANYESIGDIVDEWSRLSGLHDSAVGDYMSPNSIFLSLQLVTPALQLAMGVQYDLLNINNADGRFDGTLMFTGRQAFVEKSGAKIVFGSDDTVKENAVTGNQQVGDHFVENGEANLSACTFKSEDYTERGGAKISHNYIEIVKLSDGSMALLYLYASESDDGGEPTTDAVFIRVGETVYEYVVAASTEGTGFDAISLGSGFDRAEARNVLESAGYAITESGSVVDGAIVAD